MLNANATPNVRTLEEKKVLTEDALKWSKNRLSKALNLRIKQAEKICEATRIALYDPIEEYDAEALKLAKMRIDTVVDDSLWSISHVNHIALSSEGHVNGQNSGLYGSLTIVRRDLVFGSEYTHATRGPVHHKKGKIHSATGIDSLRRDIREMEEKGDFTVPVVFGARYNLWDLDTGSTFHEDQPDFSKRIKLRMDASSKLISIRTKLVPLYDAMDRADKDLALAKEDLANLDENIEELEMQAIEQRLREAGGRDILESMQTGIEKMLASGGFNATPTLIGDAGPERDKPEGD